jgi:hypothetical protein
MYSLDGSEPTPTRGVPYTGPISIGGNSSKAVINIRAIAFKAGMLSSRVVTHSYIFPQFVLNQPANPAGFPDSWITQTNAVNTNATVIPLITKWIRKLLPTPLTLRWPHNR